MRNCVLYYCHFICFSFLQIYAICNDRVSVIYVNTVLCYLRINSLVAQYSKWRPLVVNFNDGLNSVDWCLIGCVYTIFGKTRFSMVCSNHSLEETISLVRMILAYLTCFFVFLLYIFITSLHIFFHLTFCTSCANFFNKKYLKRKFVL